MTRLQYLLDAVGQALCEKGRRAITGQVAFGDVLPDVARVTLDYLRKYMPADEIRLALGELAAADPAAYRGQVAKTIDGLARVQSVPFKDELADYLTHFPLTARQVFRRPPARSAKTLPSVRRSSPSGS
jgi:hypothetical protein